MRRLKAKVDDVLAVSNDAGPPLPEDEVDPKLPRPEAKKLVDEMLEKAGDFTRGLSDAADRKVATASIGDLEEISDPVEAGPKLVQCLPGMRRMVEKAFPGEEEIPTIYETTREWLQAVDPGHAMSALNTGELLWHQLSRAVAGAKLEKKKWETANAVAFSSLWEASNKELQAEKDSGKRNKTITDKDTEARCAARFPDAWRYQEIEKEKLHRTVTMLEQMLEQVSSRVRTLTTIVNKGR